MTEATNTGPFIAFDAAMKAPSGDQLTDELALRQNVHRSSPQTPKECRFWRVLERLLDSLDQLPRSCIPDFHRFIIRLSSSDLVFTPCVRSHLSSQVVSNWIPRHTFDKVRV